MEYPIPKDSAAAYRQHQRRGGQNPSLIFDRFVPDWGSSRNRNAKRNAWLEVEAVCNKGDPSVLQAWNTRWEKIVAAAHAEPFTLSTDWRMVAGLGQKGPLEAGFTFHRYGFPILPGSTLKGIARTWGLLKVAEALGGGEISLNELNQGLSEEKTEVVVTMMKEFIKQDNIPETATHTAAAFRTIFGTHTQAGRAIFFDATPARLPRLELDVMTPHYGPYYQDENSRTPPANWHSPSPILFLTVAAGAAFRFAVGWRGELDVNLRNLASDWLRDGLTELGAGAKTSAGYGYFVETERTAPVETPQPPGETHTITRQRLLKENPPSGRFRGIVVNIQRGGRFGFINPARGGPQMFVHSSQVRGNLPLREGQVVEYKIGKYNDRDQAQDVEILLEPPD